MTQTETTSGSQAIETLLPDSQTASANASNGSADKSLPLRGSNRSAIFRNTIFRWTTLLARFVSIQIIVQALGMMTGIMLVRKLTQREYAYFTLANTMQATLLLLADIGVGSALSALGGQVWQDRRRFGELIQTGLHVRKRLAWIGGLVSLPVLCGLLLKNGTGLPYACLLAAAVLFGANFRLTNDVLTFVPKLHGRIDQLQKLDLWAAIFRLLALGAACLTFINAAVGILVGSLSFGIQYMLLRRWTTHAADPTAPINADDKKEIYRVIRQMAPNTIYYCIHSQITVFLISLFGNATTLAELGALGRLGAIFTIVSSVLTNVALPRYARCTDPRRLVHLYWTIVGAFSALSVLLMSLVIFWPDPLLAILGHRYAHLHRELAYVVGGNIVVTFVGLFYSLNTTKGWVEKIWMSIPIIIVSQLLMIPAVNLATIEGVTLISTLPTIIGLIPLWYRAYVSIKRLSRT